jgi:hypothetical protein
MTSAMSSGVRGSTPLDKMLVSKESRRSRTRNLTHRRRLPWTCRRRSGQRRIPIPE